MIFYNSPILFIVEYLFLFHLCHYYPRFLTHLFTYSYLFILKLQSRNVLSRPRQVLMIRSSVPYMTPPDHCCDLFVEFNYHRGTSTIYISTHPSFQSLSVTFSATPAIIQYSQVINTLSKRCSQNELSIDNKLCSSLFFIIQILLRLDNLSCAFVHLFLLSSYEWFYFIRIIVMLPSLFSIRFSLGVGGKSLLFGIETYFRTIYKLIGTYSLHRHQTISSRGKWILKVVNQCT